VKKPILQPLSSVIEEEVAVGSSSTATPARVTISVIPCSGLDRICARIIARTKNIFFSAEFSRCQEKMKKVFEILLVVSLRTEKRGSLGRYLLLSRVQPDLRHHNGVLAQVSCCF